MREIRHDHNRLDRHPSEHHHDHWHGERPYGFDLNEKPWDPYPGIPRNDCCPNVDEQLPIYSTIGKGLRGDSYRVLIYQDSDKNTKLAGYLYNETTKQWSENPEWISKNINGGRLYSEVVTRPGDIPQTFTMTFRYERPERDPYEWHFTTPAIPYTWDVDGDGKPDTETVVGTGVSSLFVKQVDKAWETPENDKTPHTVAEAAGVQEKLLYPAGWKRSQFNAPGVTDPWTVNLTYGVGGDIDTPSVDDLAKIIGVTPAFLRRLVKERSIPEGDTFGNHSNGKPINVKEYIDKQDAAEASARADADTALKNHMHQDFGWASNWNNCNGAGSTGDGSTPLTIEELVAADIANAVKNFITRAQGNQWWQAKGDYALKSEVPSATAINNLIAAWMQSNFSDEVKTVPPYSYVAAYSKDGDKGEGRTILENLGFMFSGNYGGEGTNTPLYFDLIEWGQQGTAGEESNGFNIRVEWHPWTRLVVFKLNGTVPSKRWSNGSNSYVPITENTLPLCKLGSDFIPPYQWEQCLVGGNTTMTIHGSRTPSETSPGVVWLSTVDGTSLAGKPCSGMITFYMPSSS